MQPVVRVLHPRCPFCREVVRPGERQLACNRCRTWHHQACWAESGSSCSVCRGRESGEHRWVEVSSPPTRAPWLPVSLEELDVLGWWFALAGLAASVERWIIPAFRRMFAETGIPLPGSTEAVVRGDLTWYVLLAALFILQLRSALPKSCRQWCVSGALLLAACYALFLVGALFCPCISMPEKL